MTDRSLIFLNITLWLSAAFIIATLYATHPANTSSHQKYQVPIVGQQVAA